jgi:hypothetical protein
MADYRDSVTTFVSEPDVFVSGLLATRLDDTSNCRHLIVRWRLPEPASIYLGPGKMVATLTTNRRRRTRPRAVRKRLGETASIQGDITAPRITITDGVTRECRAVTTWTRNSQLDKTSAAKGDEYRRISGDTDYSSQDLARAPRIVTSQSAVMFAAKTRPPGRMRWPRYRFAQLRTNLSSPANLPFVKNWQRFPDNRA